MILLTNVGRRSLETLEESSLVRLGGSSLNGYERNCLFENDGKGGFEEVAYHRGADAVPDGRGLLTFDYDNNGTTDLYVANYRRRGTLLKNEVAPGRWLKVRLTGTQSNRDAVGARLTLHCGDARLTREVQIGSAHLSASSKVQHFGLGALPHPERLVIRWPSGLVQEVTDLPERQTMDLLEPNPDQLARAGAP